MSTPGEGQREAVDKLLDEHEAAAGDLRLMSRYIGGVPIGEHRAAIVRLETAADAIRDLLHAGASAVEQCWCVTHRVDNPACPKHRASVPEPAEETMDEADAAWGRREIERARADVVMTLGAHPEERIRADVEGPSEPEPAFWQGFTRRRSGGRWRRVDNATFNYLDDGQAWCREESEEWESVLVPVFAPSDVAAPATQEAPSTSPSAPAEPLTALGRLANEARHHQRSAQTDKDEAIVRAALSVSTSAPKETSEPQKRYVVGFLFDRGGIAVLLLRKNRPAWQAGKLNGMGGHVEPGESYEAAMVRECAEECAGRSFDWKLFAVLGSPDHPKGSNETWEMACFRAQVDGYLVDVPARNDVGETFEAPLVHDVINGLVATIPNLAWLLPMALHDSTNWPYRLTERASLATPEPAEPREETR